MSRAATSRSSQLLTPTGAHARSLALAASNLLGVKHYDSASQLLSPLAPYAMGSTENAGPENARPTLS